MDALFQIKHDFNGVYIKTAALRESRRLKPAKGASFQEAPQNH
jgi:hypothetical protein